MSEEEKLLGGDSGLGAWRERFGDFGWYGIGGIGGCRQK
jgi:hypothetical protein